MIYSLVLSSIINQLFFNQLLFFNFLYNKFPYLPTNPQSQMHSQQLLTQIKSNLYTDPQKSIKTLSNRSFINNLFHQHLIQLTQILQTALNKSIKDNKSLSYANPESTNKRQEELNAQLIVCMYSIIIMKSTSKSVVLSDQSPIYNTKVAIQTLSKIHKQVKREQVKKIVAALLLKIPTFSNHKNIIRDISPEFISPKTMQKASVTFKTQCPNLYQQKLLAHKNTQWGRFLSYKPFKLDTYAEIFKRLQTTGNVSSDANSLIEIREDLRKEFEYLQGRIQQVNSEQVFLLEFCEKFTQLYRLRLEFPKLLEANRFAGDKGNGSKPLPSYSLNELRLKVLLQGKNHLLILLHQLIKKLGTYWTRKIKWLYEFIIQKLQTYGLQQLNLPSIQQPDIYIQKLTELKLLIKLAHTYYKVFGDGLFPQDKLKAVLFNQEYSLYKLIEALLYNEYEFTYTPENSRIVNYQKTKKVSQESKNKKQLIKTINVNSKSLNINPHYDLVFQRVIHQIALKNGQAYSSLRIIIEEALKFILTYYRKSQTYFYGGNLITMIQNCKNHEILKQRIFDIVKQIKTVLYPAKKMIKKGLEFFCEEVFENFISKKRHLQSQKQTKTLPNMSICKTSFLSIHPISLNQSGNQAKTKFEATDKSTEKKPIKKTASYDMQMEGWAKEGEIPTKEGTLRSGEMFYSIQEDSLEKQTDKKENCSNSQMFHSFKQDEPQAAADEQILMPQF